MISANPDGYQYTFDTERLWRKTLSDNNGDGQITVGDGVDPNRNFAEHWGYDNEGSSPDPADETYRGPSAASEPETQAMQGLINRIRPKFQSNLHSFGEWLLYPQGWQVGTLDADYPLYVALGGTDANSAIPGWNRPASRHPLRDQRRDDRLCRDEHRHRRVHARSSASGVPERIVFPDDEALIQAEFEKTLDFHLGLARSARDPEDPASPVGIDLEPFYLDADDIDPQNGQTSLFDFKFAVYGDPQEVRVLAKRDVGRVTLKYRINGAGCGAPAHANGAGASATTPATPTTTTVRGMVTGTDPGDTVKVWFDGGREESDSFTYDVVSDSGNRRVGPLGRGLHGRLARPGPRGPFYLSYYTDALNGVGFDVYDVDAEAAPHPTTWAC